MEETRENVQFQAGNIKKKSSDQATQKTQEQKVRLYNVTIFTKRQETILELADKELTAVISRNKY